MLTDYLKNAITYKGPEISDHDILEHLPEELASYLLKINGFILYDGALHVRGACYEPDWHSLHKVMHGELAFHQLYEVIQKDDIPFAQDCMGDQFLIRDGQIINLLAETGEIEPKAKSLDEFFSNIEKSPEEYLDCSLERKIEPGQLIGAYPPFCTNSPDDKYSLKPCPALEVIHFHASLANQIADLKDGETIEFKITD